jgi:hypothetical protein
VTTETCFLDGFGKRRVIGVIIGGLHPTGMRIGPGPFGKRGHVHARGRAGGVSRTVETALVCRSVCMRRLIGVLACVWHLAADRLAKLQVGVVLDGISICVISGIDEVRPNPIGTKHYWMWW